MKKAGKWLSVFMAGMMCLGLTACAEDLDAAGYTKSVLDASYHGEYADYAEFRNISEEEAKKEVQEEEDKIVEQQLAQFGNISDETREAYLDCLRSAQKLAKYEVKEAEKQEDGSFIVQVEVTPSDIYQTLEGQAEALMGELTTEEQQKISTDENAFAEFMIKCINKAVEENTYGDASTIEVTVAQDKNDVYGIDDAQMQKIEDALFPQE